MSQPSAQPHAPRTNEDPLLTDKEAAAYLSLTNHKTLSQWRDTKRYPLLTPTYIGRSVRYRKSVLDAWILARTEQAADSIG